MVRTTLRSLQALQPCESVVSKNRKDAGLFLLLNSTMIEDNNQPPTASNIYIYIHIYLYPLPSSNGVGALVLTATKSRGSCVETSLNRTGFRRPNVPSGNVKKSQLKRLGEDALAKSSSGVLGRCTAGCVSDPQRTKYS